jgi:hypothetical protein
MCQTQQLALETNQELNEKTVLGPMFCCMELGIVGVLCSLLEFGSFLVCAGTGRIKN